MKQLLCGVLLTGLTSLVATQPITVQAQTETIDLKVLAKKARPAVLLLVVYDGTGKEIATGTGFLISSDGKLITNHHVIEGSSCAIAKTENGGLFPVESLLADDWKNDLALLKITRPMNSQFLALADSGKAEVGQHVAVIGSPLGLEGTLTEGIVSSFREWKDGASVLQITAPISAGSSGSPVLNQSGDVIGVATFVLRGGQSLNFAVPAEAVRKLLAGAVPDLPVERNFNMAAACKLIDQARQSQQVEGANSEMFQTKEWRTVMAAVKLRELNLSRYRLGSAFNDVEDLVQHYPDRPESHLNWGIIHMMHDFAGERNRILASFREAIKLKPDYAEAWYEWGGVNFRMGEYDDATRMFRHAIQINHDYEEAWFYLGCAYYQQKKYDEAVDATRLAIKLNPKHAEPWNLLGGIYRDQGKFEDAEAAYRHVLTIDPTIGDMQRKEAWYYLGLMYCDQGKRNEARSALESLRMWQPDTASIATLVKVIDERTPKSKPHALDSTELMAMDILKEKGEMLAALERKLSGK